MAIFWCLFRFASGLVGISMDPSPPKVRWHPVSDLDMYAVTGDELDRIENESLEVGQDFQFASVWLTIAIAFLVALLSTTIDSLWVFMFFLLMVICGITFTVYFGWSWLRKRGMVLTTINKIRARQVGTAGDEANPLPPENLSSPPAEQGTAPTQIPIQVADAVGAVDAGEQQ